MDRRTGRRTKPFSIPKTVRMANTAKKYLKDGERRYVTLKITEKQHDKEPVFNQTS